MKGRLGIMIKDKKFLQSYKGGYSKWYKDVTLIKKLGRAKNLSCDNIDDMLVLYEIGKRFCKSSNAEIRLFGWTIQSFANDEIAIEIRVNKSMENKRKALRKHYKVSRG